jgi:hypothetical protein
MSQLIEKYNELKAELEKIREEHIGEGENWDDIREDDVLDKMDDVWWAMSDEERQELDSGYPVVYPVVSQDKQKAERLLSYIGDYYAAGIYVEPFKYASAIPEELRRGVMKIRPGINSTDFSYEGFDIGYPSNDIHQQVTFTDENANILLPLLRDTARAKAYSILKEEEEERSFYDRAKAIVEEIER